MAEEVKQTQNSEVVEAKPTDLAQDNKMLMHRKKTRTKSQKSKRKRLKALLGNASNFLARIGNMSLLL